MTAVDVKDINKNDVDLASSHTCINFVFGQSTIVDCREKK